MIATGASQNDRTDFLIYGDGTEVMADFSSRGPCEDGRIKPDVVAPGTYIASLQSASATDQYAWAPISPNYQYQGGTSQAGPHVSGAAAVFVQFYRQAHTNRTPSPALVKAALINSAINLDESGGTAPVPNNDEGWGRVDLSVLLDPALTFDFLDQTVLLTNSQVFERRITLGSSDQPFYATLTYTDVPGFPGALAALVNDLDLEVIGPDGTLYRGNQFSFGESIPNAPAADRLNNVENVYLAQPMPGQYVIRVRAHHIVEDARQDSPAIDQDFALVTSGSVASPGTGVLALNRRYYRAADQIKIHLADSDLAGQGSATINLWSASEVAGENITLVSAGQGVFTGTVATATGPALSDGKLQISHPGLSTNLLGDRIEARYLDASANAMRTNKAYADFRPPVLSSVTTSNQYGLAMIAWITDEPANSIVRFGTNKSLGGLTQGVTNAALTTAHEIILSGLPPGVPYYFYVVSTDEAGNAGTNDNAGKFFEFKVEVVPPILLVDSYIDPLFGEPPLGGYTNALNQVGIPYDTWFGTNLSLATLSAYRTVIWRVPELMGVWSLEERSAISNYLNSGGSILVASMDLLSRLEEAGATGFIRDVLHLKSYTVDPSSTGAGRIIGNAADPITSGLDITTDFVEYDTVWGGLVDPPDISDTILPGTNASSILQNGSGDFVGIRWPGLGQQAPGKLVVLSFPLDAVPLNGGSNDRVALLRNILSFLTPGASGAGNVALDSTRYRLPARVTVETADSDLAGQGTLVITARSTTQTNGISVMLQEASTQGVFTGSFALVSATNSAAPGWVRAKEADDITVEYFDASAGNWSIARAQVDTVAPGILNVFAEPDYVEATIYWDTTEPTDALVQYGESAFLDRTAYASDFADTHGITLSFLAPDRTYYYKVVSRDAAGNAVVDDNNGQLYVLRTLLPVLAPWSDNFETGATNWSTYSEPSFYIPGVTPEWQLGVPANQIATEAYSPQNAWGCNLTGQACDLAECFLISPAIYLTNGNVATLRFWHNYDFSDISGFDIEYGEVLVVGDNGAAASLIAFGDSSFGWVDEEVSLTAYAGQVIYLAWHYVLFTFETAPRPGWLVDDVSISVANVAPGVVQVTNNISQAGFVLSGATYRKGKGTSYTLTNAPPGEYIIEYVDVPYYVTPTAQTNTLASGATLSFVGNYTFADVNSNGMSDAWEQAYFGTVSSLRTRQTDSDGDGMTDYAEFIAGTDPTSPLPAPQISVSKPSASLLRLEWPSVIGWQYRVLSSSNLISWSQVMDPSQAISNTMRAEFAMSLGNRSTFFKVEGSGPANRPVGAPASLTLGSQRQPNSQMRLSWNSVKGRSYRVQGSTTTAVWTPVSNWILATSASSSITVTNGASPGPVLYRMEVRP